MQRSNSKSKLIKFVVIIVQKWGLKELIGAKPGRSQKLPKRGPSLVRQKPTRLKSRYVNVYWLDKTWWKLCGYLICLMILQEKKFRCGECGRRYNTKNHLDAHKRDKHSGYEYKCCICFKTCSQDQTVRRHMRRMHKDVL